MRRPVKKKRNPNIFALYDTDIVKESHAVGYNKSCDDWEEYHQPTVEEIEEIIFKNVERTDFSITLHSTDLAQAIHKRLRGEK